tara:strand:- start:149 stop:874 length:726 start_codon:yes stop_codon:yes gene_type:complete
MNKKIKRYFIISYFLRKLFSIKLLKYIFSQNFIRKKIFKYIYDSGYWIDYNVNSNQSRSGKGSNSERALHLQNSLKIFFKKNKIRKIIDIGCGDFNWMNNLLKDVEYESYLGVDIVDDLIEQNSQRFGNRKIKFISKDIVKDDLSFIKQSDFILIRHVFIHLDNSSIIKIINKIKNLDFKYLGITSDPKILKNFDLKTEGRFREINLIIEPFNLNKNYEVINESKNGVIDNVNLNVYSLKL